MKKRNSDGFTIIEVMIVLAIAALILLIVLLAVPALQRGSRNTQRKNDAAAVASAVSNFISNNGGKVPTLVASDGNDNNAVFSTTGTTNTETAKIGYYTVDSANTTGAAKSGKLYISKAGAAAPTITAVDVGSSESASNVSNQTLSIWTGVTCNSDGNGIGQLSPRSVAILYVTETGKSPGSLQCIEQ